MQDCFQKKKEVEEVIFSGMEVLTKLPVVYGCIPDFFSVVVLVARELSERVSKLSKGCVSGGGLVLRMPEQSLAYRYFAILLCCLLRVSLQLGIWILICEYY